MAHTQCPQMFKLTLDWHNAVKSKKKKKTQNNSSKCSRLLAQPVCVVWLKRNVIVCGHLRHLDTPAAQIYLRKSNQMESEIHKQYTQCPLGETQTKVYHLIPLISGWDSNEEVVMRLRDRVRANPNPRLGLNKRN